LEEETRNLPLELFSRALMTSSRNPAAPLVLRHTKGVQTQKTPFFWIEARRLIFKPKIRGFCIFRGFEEHSSFMSRISWFKKSEPIYRRLRSFVALHHSFSCWVAVTNVLSLSKTYNLLIQLIWNCHFWGILSQMRSH